MPDTASRTQLLDTPNRMIQYINRYKAAAAGGGGNGLLTGLTSYWKLDESGTGSRADAHASNDLTNFDGVDSATGVLNNGSTWASGGNRYLECASDAGLVGTGDLTIAGWFKFDDFASNHTLVSKWGLSDNAREYVLRGVTDSTIELIWYLSGGSTDVRFNHSTTLSTDTWYLIAAGRDSANDRIWISINSSAKEYHTGSTSGNSGSSGFNIGRLNTASAANHIGMADEIGVWKANLAEAKLQSLYGSGTPPSYDSFD